MKRATRLQLGSVVAAVILLEVGSRSGMISSFTFIPPSVMAVQLYKSFANGSIFPSLRSTLVGVFIAAVAAIISGFVFGSIIHALPRVRRTFEPLFSSYYAVPIWAFYPMFVFMFGLTDVPKIVIGYLYALVAMIVSTINGLDVVPKVFEKTSRVFGMTRSTTLRLIVIPYAIPYVFTGVKLAISYAFIGIVGAEFILSTSGIGYEISWAYISFENKPLYAMVLLILILSVGINMALFAWERALTKWKVEL
ncbi:ABC transporter permease [Bosea sp. (in: a-proteobacteria)]|uniref:ABC transporter permease n=1 Tax=Bosea sp. (in: a-proteobacteria) TaxID=1871050 RepID=UPI00262CC47F|nr:ABC transporter permease subunit [Bosea sp. (in: a-proteobacteria)]MCO5089632.1 ABC transporter permease subunit [Bosea sp. (in: a-proteobacteria)]